MHMQTTRALRNALAGVTIAALSAGAAMAAPTLSVTGSSTSVWGQGFSVNVVATDMTDLYGYQFDLSFDPTKFRATTVTEGSFLSSAGSTYFGSGTVDNASGTVSLVFDTLLGTGPGAHGSGTLATLDFVTIGAGAAGFTLRNVEALDSALGDIGVGTQALSVVAAVPEPTSWAMMLLGVGVLGAWSRKRRLMSR